MGTNNRTRGGAWLLVGLVLAVIAGGWWLRQQEVPMVPSIERATERSTAPAVEPPAAALPVVAPEPAPRTAIEQAPSCVLKGTLRTPDGQVVAGLELSVELLVDGAPLEVVRQRLAAPGDFAVTVPWRENRGAMLWLTGEGVAARGRVVRAIVRDEVRSLGEVHVFAGAVLTGSVRDERGHPVGELRLTLDAVEPVEQDTFGAMRVNRAIVAVDRDGAIEPDAAIRHGRWRVRLAGSGLGAVTPDEFDVQGVATRVDLVVRRGSSIEGLVLDRDGRGVPGVQLEALSIESGQRASMLPCVSDERGAFVLRAADAAADAAPVLVQLIGGVDRQRYRIGAVEPVAWGASGYTVLVGEAPYIELQVLDAASGRAIEDYAFCCEPDDTLVWGGAGAHPAGRVRVEPAGAGPWSLSVLPADSQWPIVLRRPVTEADAAAPLVLTIERRPQLVVSVRDGGVPVRGARVRCFGLAREGLPYWPAEARAIDAIGHLLAYHGTGPAQLAMASTGDDGTATMRALPQCPGAIWLCVEAPGHAVLLRGIADAAQARIDVSLERDAQVTGQILRDAATNTPPRVVACPMLGDTATPGPIAATAHLAGDDTFSLTLAPGGYGLWLLTNEACRLLTTVTVTAGEQRPLGPLQEPR